MPWTDGLQMRVELDVYEDGRAEAHLYVKDATYAQAEAAIQGVLPLQMVPVILTFEGDMTEVKRYTQAAGVPMLE